MNKIEGFEDLKVWQDGISIAVDIYSAFQKCNDFGLRDQIQRSAVSIPSNIAEGFDRQTSNEFIRFLRVAKGSCGELRTQLIIAHKVGVITDESFIERTKHLSAMIQKLISYRTQLKENSTK